MIPSGVPVPLAAARIESELGGKAVQLGAAIRAELPVPPGFALPAELVAGVVSRGPACTAALADVRASLEGPLAVRSSCVGEDGAAASFAGIHQTVLGATTVAQLAESVERIWRSARAESALAYRWRLGLAGEPRMGVVVQQLVEPTVAGVLFTRNPVTGAHERLIEASWGLGEAVVQGLVTPDRSRVSNTGAILERIAGDKQWAVRLKPGGSTATEAVSLELAAALCLEDGALGQLHGIALRCEQSFEGPSDIEWALADGGVHLLQRRAITRAPA